MIVCLIVIVTAYFQVTSITAINQNYITDDYFDTPYGTYKLHRSNVTWNEARRICMTENAQLVSIKSRGEEAMIQEVKSYYGEVTMVWTGVHDLFQSHNWTTLEGEELSYTNWSARQPENKDEHCVVLWGGWHDWNCSAKKNFVCRKRDWSSDCQQEQCSLCLW